MSRFFIDRPIFAWVIALFIIVIGLVSVTQLPIAQYPKVAPPAIEITATYPGASAKEIEESVLEVIEREMNGAVGMVYMESVAQSNVGSVTISFENGTDDDMAQVDVQNRLARATPRLPEAVTRLGVQVDKASVNFLLFGMLSSENPAYDPIALGDYAARNVVPEIQRLSGVGKVQLFGSERAMRIWLDPAKLEGYRLSVEDVAAAIRSQNAQVASGVIGDLPLAEGQKIAATVTALGQLSTPAQFGTIVLRANPDGSTVRLRDVADIELGGQGYATSARLKGEPAVGFGVQLSPTGNALATAQAVHKRMEELKAFFPEGVRYEIPYDSSKFVRVSISKVVTTLFEAVLLVFVVMYLFLQNWRYTVIPTIVVPIALLGSFGVMFALGFSVNVLTMFGMVLVIGIVVDDAIVVVENVERIMSDEGLSPRDAAIKAMGQISGAIVGVTVVLISVFVPLALFSGSIGNIYRQFAVVMVSSISFSAFMALTLTPALCATLLKQVAAGHHHARRGFFGWFNRSFSRTAKGYEGFVGWLLKRAPLMMVLYVGIAAAAVHVYRSLPTGFLPPEDQGLFIVNMQLPPGATQERTRAVVQEVEQTVLAQPEVESMVAVLGFSFSGMGQNAALSFVSLKDWDERKDAQSHVESITGRIMGLTRGIRDAFVFAINPPSIQELGNAEGFSFRLQDRAGHGHEALVGARNMMLGMMMQSPVLTGVRPDGLEDAPQLRLEIDRDKARALGVDFSAINAALSTALGSVYVNDFPNQGRMQRVVVQAQAASRMQTDDILRLNARNNRGELVPLSAFTSTRWVKGAQQAVRYNGYPALRIEGAPAPGRSTGDALAEVEKLAAKLPPGFGYEWTGVSREEKQAGSQAIYLYAFAILSIFLCLAALYESWSIPFSVILAVPLGMLGVVLATLLRQYSIDVYFQIGLVTVIGISAKNAILIIEFAKDAQAAGKGLIESALEAAHLRFRPIIMTSLAFGMGVLPLAIATGASSASQRAIGTGVIGGMITGTTLAILFVPAFFVVVRGIFKYQAKLQPDAAAVV